MSFQCIPPPPPSTPPPFIGYAVQKLPLLEQALKDEKAKNLNLEQKIKSLESTLETTESRFKIIREDFSQNLTPIPIFESETDVVEGNCPFCEARAPYMPPGGETCWTLTQNMQEWLTITMDDLEDARSRLSKTTVCPESVEAMNAIQKCVTSYLKIFRGFHGIGRSGHRVVFPECIVSRVRQEWPRGFNNAHFEGVEQVLNPADHSSGEESDYDPSDSDTDDFEFILEDDSDDIMGNFV